MGVIAPVMGWSRAMMQVMLQIRVEPKAVRSRQANPRLRLCAAARTGRLAKPSGNLFRAGRSRQLTQTG